MPRLQDDALELGYELRLLVGADKVGVGPDMAELIKLNEDWSAARLKAAIDELERLGFIRVDRAIPTADRPGPPELRAFVGVAVLEQLQAYFDHRGL